MALLAALSHPGEIAGIVSIGAFWSPKAESLRGLGHAQFVLLCGNEDPAAFELASAREELRSRGWKVLSGRFAGGHQWPPREACAETIEFFEVGAMERGWIAGEPSRMAAFVQRQGRSAAEAEGSGWNLQAMRLQEDLLALFPADPSQKGAPGRIRALKEDPEVRRELRLEALYRDRTNELHARLATASVKMEEFQALHDTLPAVTPMEAVMIRRMMWEGLSNLSTAYWTAAEKGDWTRTGNLARALMRLDEREPRYVVWYAISQVQLGHLKEGLGALRLALGKGYRRIALLRAHPYLQGLKGNPEFEEILSTAPK